MVRTWLISAIHNDLLDDSLEYADEFLRKIKKIFVGSYAGDHTHKIWYPDNGKIVRSSHVDLMKMTTKPSRDQLPVAHVVLHSII
jgi:hypothetical protein